MNYRNDLIRELRGVRPALFLCTLEVFNIIHIRESTAYKLYVVYTKVRFKVKGMSVNSYGGSGQLVDEALTGHQWNIHWSQSSGGASGSPQSPDGGSQ